ncbi:MAG: hypothetical protein QW327_02365 [Candidatus Odinarchaeota archaeon]
MSLITAADALNAAVAETEPVKRSEKFFEACVLLFKSGCFNDALKYLPEIQVPELFIKIATDDYFNMKLSEMGMVNKLQEVLKQAQVKLDSLSEGNSKINLALKIAVSYFRIGLIQETHKIIKYVLDALKRYTEGDRDELLCSLVDVQSKIGDFKESRETVSEIKNPFFKSLALLYIVKAFSFKEQTDEAILVANEIEDPIQRSNAFTYIAVALIKKRNIHEAKLIAALITVPAWRERVEHWIKVYK